MNLWLLTKKNLKLLIRDKSSALIIVFAPLLIILILGLSFNNSESLGLSIGVQATTHTADVNSFKASLQKEGFSIVDHSDIEACLREVELGDLHACISLPDTFTVDSNTKKEITLHTDPSRANLVSTIQQAVEKQLNLKSQKISQDLAGAALSQMQTAASKIEQEKGKVDDAKEKSQTASESSTNVKTALGGLDFASTTSDYDFSPITKFKTNITTLSNEGQDHIKDAEKIVENLSIGSSDKDDILDLLTDAEKTFEEVTKQATTGSFKRVSDLINSLDQNLQSADKKLKSLSSGVNAQVNGLSSVETSLQESISALEALSSSIDSAIADLNSLTVTESGVISSPLAIKVETIKEGTKLNFLFPALLVLVIMFASLLLGTSLVMMEKNSPAFIRNYFVPVSKVTFIISTYLTNLILILVQLIVILSISLLFLKEAWMTFHYLALVLFLAASVFTFLGMAIGYLFVSEETGVLASISLGSLMLFISGVIIPIEGMAPWLRDIAMFNPFVICEKLIRQMLLFTPDFNIIWVDLLILVGYAVVLFLVILIIESLLHEQLRTKFMRHKHKQHVQKQKRVKQ